MKTAELLGERLDYWVARALGWHEEGDFWRGPTEITGRVTRDDNPVQAEVDRFRPSRSWAYAGPIIDRADIWMSSDDTLAAGHPFIASCHPHSNNAIQAGPAKLIAAMRAYVASKYGDEVPE